MPHSLVWLPQVLRDAGLKVATVPDWETRGRGDVSEILGVICHYTAGPREGNMPCLHTLINGRVDLAGPLAQLGLGRDGTYYVIAAGRCNHAGAGVWQGIMNGNANFIGIEAENTGRADDFPWPAVQLDAYHRGVAAILRHVGQSADFCAGHKEFARPLGRKADPSLDMFAFRSTVAGILNGTVTAPTLIPSVEPAGGAGAPARATLRRPTDTVAPIPEPVRALTRTLQRILGLDADGVFGAKTEAAVRAFQRAHGMVPDGIVGPKTWKALDTVV